MRMTGLVLAVIGCVSHGFSGPQADPPITVRPQVESPDGKLAIGFRLSDLGAPEWHVLRKGAALLDWSPLGLTFREDKAAPRFAVVDSSTRAHDETYPLVIGKAKDARDHYRELRVDLEARAPARRKLTILFRAYDDGAAFRYVLPAQESLGAFEIVKEDTEFRFPADMKAWALRTETFQHAYEGQFVPTTVGAIPETGMVCLPLTMQRDDGVALSITEADLTDYAGMYLRGRPGTALEAVLAPLPDGSGAAVRGKTPFVSPWRVLMTGDAPARLVESTIVLNLNPPCALNDVSWIKPGKAIFPWWPDFYCDKPGVPSALGFENQKYYIDFAADSGFDYLELEPPWYGPEVDCIEHPEKYDITQPVPELRLPELIEYGKRAGVRLFIWAHWHNVGRQADVAFPLYRSWGAAGVKVDFMNRDDQEMVRYYHTVLKKAAANQLMVLFHGAYKPTGTQRTYPNLVTLEGVLGNEQNKVNRLITPEHTVTLPFTRMLAGPFDFTPGGFRSATAKEFAPDMKRPKVMGTRCRQLAMFVVYESPIGMVCDDPAAYRGQPEFAFIQDVPTTWNETQVIDGEIGRHITIARKRGGDWYLGAMTDWTARTVQVPLGFLGPGKFEAGIYQDGPDADTRPSQVTILNREFTAADTLAARLAKGGGLAVRFRKL